MYRLVSCSNSFFVHTLLQSQFDRMVKFNTKTIEKATSRIGTHKPIKHDDVKKETHTLARSSLSPLLSGALEWINDYLVLNRHLILVTKMNLEGGAIASQAEEIGSLQKLSTDANFSDLNAEEVAKVIAMPPRSTRRT